MKMRWALLAACLCLPACGPSREYVHREWYPDGNLKSERRVALRDLNGDIASRGIRLKIAGDVDLTVEATTRKQDPTLINAAKEGWQTLNVLGSAVLKAMGFM